MTPLETEVLKEMNWIDVDETDAFVTVFAVKKALALLSAKFEKLIDDDLQAYDLMKEPCRREDNTCKEAFENNRTIDMCSGCEYNFQLEWKVSALTNLKEKLKD